jgi:hypothetical protein
MPAQPRGVRRAGHLCQYWASSGSAMRQPNAAAGADDTITLRAPAAGNALFTSPAQYSTTIQQGE